MLNDDLSNTLLKILKVKNKLYNTTEQAFAVINATFLSYHRGKLPANIVAVYPMPPIAKVISKLSQPL